MEAGEGGGEVYEVGDIIEESIEYRCSASPKTNNFLVLDKTDIEGYYIVLHLEQNHVTEIHFKRSPMLKHRKVG